VAGTVVSGVGTQMVLVALPYQVYVETRSALLTGLVGAAELVPLVGMSVWGGGIVDRYDRRKVLLLDQVALILIAAALAAVSFAGSPPVAVLLVLAGAMAGAGAVQNIARSAMLPNLVPSDELREAIALHYGLLQLTFIVGPAVGGLVLASAEAAVVYLAHAACSLGMVGAVLALSPQRPPPTVESMGRLVAEGLRFVKGNPYLVSSMSLDLLAMTCAMPRALFPVLSVSVFGSGAAGAGLLHSAVAVGATGSALLTGWVGGARRLGRILVFAVVVWGAAVAVAGLSRTLWVAALLFVVAGAADSVSAVCRSAISQSVTPDRVRGRMSSVYSLAVASGPRLGDITSGSVASAVGASATVVAGGLACIAGTLLLAARLPALLAYDAKDWLAERTMAG
jgi:MFS family permease